VLDYGKNWDEYLALENSPTTTVIKSVLIWHLMKNCMAIGALLHALNWSEPSKRVIFGPNLIMEAEEMVQLIQSNLRAALS